MWTPGNSWGYQRLIFYEPVKCSDLLSMWFTIFQTIKKVRNYYQVIYSFQFCILRIIVLGMISDQGEYCFVKKKKIKRKESAFIYLLCCSNWLAAQTQTLALTLAVLFLYSLHKSFELGANIAVTKNNPTLCLSWEAMFYNISLPQPYLYSSLLQTELHNK